MDEKKSEKMKAMVLFCIMFIGINYALYNYVIVPKEMDVVRARESYTVSGETKDVYQSLEAANKLIEADIEELTGVENVFDSYVSKQLDTIQMTYDFYTFAKNMEIDGISVVYDINALKAFEETRAQLSGTEGESFSNDDPMLEADPMQEAGMVEDPMAFDDSMSQVDDGMGEMNVEEEPRFITIPITLVLEFEKYQLSNVLAYLDVISNQKIYERNIVFELQMVETAIGEEITREDYIVLTINYDSYIDAMGDVSSTDIIYAFYSEEIGYEDVANLFASQIDEENQEDVTQE